LKIYQIVNDLFGSNTFVIRSNNNSVTVIDPGFSNNDQLLILINENNWQIQNVILTHEHADHVVGLLNICKTKLLPVYCSKVCGYNICSNKHNLSKYIEEINTFELDLPTQIIHDGETVKIGEADFLFIETPGHSPGGVCIFTADSVFVGDTILNKQKVPLNFPHSNKLEYTNSLKKLEKYIKPGITVYPGHGEPFKFHSFENLVV
jgi:hydroxyacylglutathione hydrolase